MALYFPGSTAYAQYTSMPNLASSNWSVAFWVQTSSSSTTQEVFTTTSEAGLRTRVNGSGTVFSNSQHTTSGKFVNTTLGFRNGWHHLVCQDLDWTSLAGNTASVTVDGTATTLGSAAAVGTRVAWATTWYIGASDFGGGAQFTGAIAGLGVWDRKLDRDEIALLASGSLPTEFPYGLRFAPPLRDHLFDPVTSTLGVRGGSMQFAEDPPQMQHRCTARIYSFAPPAAGATYTPRLFLLGVG